MNPYYPYNGQINNQDQNNNVDMSDSVMLDEQQQQQQFQQQQEQYTMYVLHYQAGNYVQSFDQNQKIKTLTPYLADPEKRITIWNTIERRKISGNAAPMGKNLISYLEKHPHCEVYDSQDKQVPTYPPFANTYSIEQQQQIQQIQQMQPALTIGDGQKPLVLNSNEKRVTIWHKEEKRKISGNAAPMEKNLKTYLETHPNCERYTNQDKLESNSNLSAVSQILPSTSIPVPVNQFINGDEIGKQEIDSNQQEALHQQQQQQQLIQQQQQQQQQIQNQQEREEASFLNAELLTPVEPFSFGVNFQENIAIMPSPSFVSTFNHSSMAISPVSSIGSLASMEFSLGSQSHSFPDKLKFLRAGGGGAAYGSYGGAKETRVFFMEQPQGNQSRNRQEMEFESDKEEEGRQRSSTIDDFGVMGKPEGF